MIVDGFRIEAEERAASLSHKRDAMPPLYVDPERIKQLPATWSAM